MDDHQTLTVLLTATASQHQNPSWNAASLPSINRVYLFDASDAASLIIIEAIAGQQGTVTATGSHTSELGTVCGCLIEPGDNDAKATAARLRLSYMLAINPDDSEPADEPF